MLVICILKWKSRKRLTKHRTFIHQNTTNYRKKRPEARGGGAYLSSQLLWGLRVKGEFKPRQHSESLLQRDELRKPGNMFHLRMITLKWRSQTPKTSCCMILNILNFRKWRQMLTNLECISSHLRTCVGRRKEGWTKRGPKDTSGLWRKHPVWWYDADFMSVHSSKTHSQLFTIGVRFCTEIIPLQIYDKNNVK